VPSPIPVVDPTASMQPERPQPMSPRNRSQSVARVPEPHRMLRDMENEPGPAQ